MIQKLKNFRRKTIQNIAQIYADVLIKMMQSAQSSGDTEKFWMLFEQAAKLNAYCIVFHDIYLD